MRFTEMESSTLAAALAAFSLGRRIVLSLTDGLGRRWTTPAVITAKTFIGQWPSRLQSVSLRDGRQIDLLERPDRFCLGANQVVGVSA